MIFKKTNENINICFPDSYAYIWFPYRKAKELEELKKDVFLAKNVNDKDHDAEKTKAKIQDLHR